MQDRKDPAVESEELVSRLRELYYFSPDMHSLIRHVIDLRTRAAVADWAAQKGNIADLPWRKIADALKRLLEEPPLYARDWSEGPVEERFGGAIAGEMNLASIARDVKEASGRGDEIDPVLLVGSTVTLFRLGCEDYLKRLQSPAADLLRPTFDTILRRADLGLEMFPAALTYFGEPGLAVRNLLATETQAIRDRLQKHVDGGYCDFGFDESSSTQVAPVAESVVAIAPQVFPQAAPKPASVVDEPRRQLPLTDKPIPGPTRVAIRADDRAQAEPTLEWPRRTKAIFIFAVIVPFALLFLVSLISVLAA